MNTNKESFTDKLKNEFISTHFAGNIKSITALSLCILLILISLLILVGILS
ncbi:hypothetical protein ES703_10383 [subsurface metagenome]